MENQAAIEAGLRAMSWKQRVKVLKQAVEQHHRPQELPTAIRRWLEINRQAPTTPEETATAVAQLTALQAWLTDPKGEASDWFKDKTETVPISGWAIEATHVLRDGARWWLVRATRHDDAAPLVGPTVPSPANAADMKRLGKIIDYAGGNRKRELLRTGAITLEEHQAGTEYGSIFYWWDA